MNHAQVVTAAKEAVEIARAKYGKGWEYISEDQKIGAAVQTVVNNFSLYAPDSTAREVAEVVGVAAGICAGDEE